MALVGLFIYLVLVLNMESWSHPVLRQGKVQKIVINKQIYESPRQQGGSPIKQTIF